VQTDYKEQHEAAGPMIIYGHKNEKFWRVQKSVIVAMDCHDLL